MGVKLVQTNFSSGELDPLMLMRHDVGAYQNGARRLRNVALLNQGGVCRRPGTFRLTGLTGRTRLMPFEFSAAERYVLAFSAARLDAFDLDGVLINTVTGCPWTEAMLFELTAAQAADVMIVCHPALRTQVIRRVSLTSFTRADLVFDRSINGDKIYQPYYKFADEAVTLRCSATTGSVTVTASAAYFTSAYVGQRLRWFDVELDVTAYTNATTLTATVKGTLEGRYDIDPFKTATGSATVEVTHALHGFATGAVVTIAGANATAGIAAGDLNGARTITVIDDNTYSFAAGTAATSSEDGGGANVKFSGANLPTRNWEEPSFSTVQGWPGAVTFHEARLWFGGSAAQPDALWSSKINGFFNFDIGRGEDNESIQVTVGAADISSVRHMVSNRHLQVFTATGEFFCPRAQQTTLTPSNFVIARQTPYGSSTLSPQPFDGATIYVQATKKAVREFLYTDAEQAYNAPTLTLLADHLIRGPQDMAVSYGTSERGEQYLLVVNGNDGSMAVFHSARAEKLAGWTLWTTADPSGTAKFDSVMVVADMIYVSVRRGAGYVLERFADQDLDNTLDCATTFEAATATTGWALGAAYANKTVSVVSNDYYLGDFAVPASGEIVLGDAVTRITVGYNYVPEVETMPVHLQLADGFYTGRPKRIARVILGLDETLAVSLQGNRLTVRQVRDDFSQSPLPVSGKREFHLLGFNRDATVSVTQTEPLPMRLLGVAMEVSA